MLGEATLDALGTFLGEAIRIPILIVAPFQSRLQYKSANFRFLARPLLAPGGFDPMAVPWG